MKGLFFAIFSVVVWGITFVSTKYLLVSFSSFEILFFRYIVAYVALWILHPHILKLKNKKEEITYILAGLTGVIIYQLMENIAINYTNASNVSIIVSICPMFTAITARIFNKEKSLSPRFVIGFLIAIIGVVLVSFNGVIEFSLNPKGDFLALGAGISWGFYSLFVSKMNSYGYSSTASTRRVFFYALIFMIPIALFEIFISKRMEFATIQNFKNPMNITNILFLGVVASGLCFIFWNKACNLLGTVRASVGIYLIPVVTVIFAYFVLGEKLSLMGIIGAVCTIVGVFESTKK